LFDFLFENGNGVRPWPETITGIFSQQQKKATNTGNLKMAAHKMQLT